MPPPDTMKVSKLKAAFLPQQYARPEQNLDFDKPFRENPALMERIRLYDPELVIFYNKAAASYAIARKKKGGGLHFITSWIDHKTGMGLPFDNRLLGALRSWDMRPPSVGAPTSANAVARRQEDEEEALRKKIDTDFDGDISHLTRDNRRQLERVYSLIR